MRIFFGFLIVAVAAFGLIQAGPISSASDTGNAGSSEPVTEAIPVTDQPVTAVMFYSNWCAACQILDPKIEKAKLGFGDRPVDFVKFNFSYALVQGGKLQALADEKNLPTIYAKNKGKTGFMLLIEPKTERIMDVITMRDSVEQISAKIDHSLQRGAPAVVAEVAG